MDSRYFSSEEEYMDYYIHNSLDEEKLPIAVKLEIKNKFGLNEFDAQNNLSEALELRKKFYQCEKVGHDMIAINSSFSPESGSEYLACRKCNSTAINYYY